MSWEVAQTSQEVLASLATPVAGIERQGERGGEHSQHPGSRPLSHGPGSHSEAYFSVRCAGRKGARELLRALHTPAPGASVPRASPSPLSSRTGSRTVGGQPQGSGQRGAAQPVSGRPPVPWASGAPSSSLLSGRCGTCAGRSPGAPRLSFLPQNIPTEREEEATGRPRSGRREGGGGAVSGSGPRRRHLQTAGKATAGWAQPSAPGWEALGTGVPEEGESDWRCPEDGSS